MNLLYIFLGLYYVENGYAHSNIECAAAMTTFPPASDSGCCSEEVKEAEPIDGPTTTIYQYPWVAVIEYSRFNTIELFCGGSLISGKYVLTAAHCITGRLLDWGTPVNVRLGEYNNTNNGPDCGTEDCTEGEITIAIEKTIPHPRYKFDVSYINNIALIKMKKTAPYSDFIRPICLPTEDFTRSNGPITLILSAFNTAYSSQSVKVQVDLPFIPKDECQKALSTKVPNIIVRKGQICAGGMPKKDSCQGDDGMPLMYRNGRRYELVGLVSFGVATCGTENIPSVYTDVYDYRSWIMNNIA